MVFLKCNGSMAEIIHIIHAFRNVLMKKLIILHFYKIVLYLACFTVNKVCCFQNNVFWRLSNVLESWNFILFNLFKVGYNECSDT